MTPEQERITDIQRRIQTAKLLMANAEDPTEKQHWQKVAQDHEKLLKEYQIPKKLSSKPEKAKI